MFQSIHMYNVAKGLDEDNKVMIKHQFSEPWNNSDVKLIAEFKEKMEVFHVHSLVLSIASPVFAESLKNDENDETKEIKLSEKNPKIVLRMLQIIYPIDGIISDNTDIPELLSFAKEYKIERIFSQVDQFLVSHRATIDLKYFILAEKFKLIKTKKKYLKYCVTSDTVLRGNWDEIKEQTRLMLLYKRIRRLYTDGENECAKTYGVRRCINKQRKSCRVLKKNFTGLQKLAKCFVDREEELETSELRRKQRFTTCDSSNSDSYDNYSDPEYDFNDYYGGYSS